MDRARRAGLRGRQAAVLPAARGRGRPGRRCAGDDPFIMQADGKGWLYAPDRAAGRPAAERTTSRRSRRSATRCTASRPTRPGEVFPRTDNLLEPLRRRAGRRGVPVRVHHLPADRAPHRRRDEPLAALPVRAAAGVLLRGLARAGPGARAGATSAGRRSSPPGPPIEARVLVTERVVPLRVGGRIIHQIGLPYHWGVGGDAVVTGDSANDLFGRHARPERAHPGDQGRPRATSSRAAARAARPCWSTSRPTAGGPASPLDTGNELRNPPAGPTAARARMASGKEQHDRRSSGPPGRLLVRLHRSAGPARDAGWDGVAAAQGVLHRHLDLHRLQGLRGGLQGVERHPRRRLQHARQLVRQHRRAERRAPGGTSRSSSSRKPSATRVDLGMPALRPAERVPGRRRADRVPLADGLRRLQALHQRRPAWTSARPARCSGPSSAPWSCRTTSATAAATACRPARSA